MKDLCYWSIGDGPYGFLLQALVNSFHEVGMQEDFVAISDRQIYGAYTYVVPEFDKNHYMFKFNLLHEIMSELDYRYFCFLDADCLFLRKVENLLKVMHGSPIHAFLESDCTSIAAIEKKKQWKNCPLLEYVKMMRELGIQNERIYSVNGGFFIVAKEAVIEVCRLAYEFWIYSLSFGHRFPEEPLLAYAVQKLMKDPELHTLKNNPEIWATDWKGLFKHKPPQDEPWDFEDFMTGESFTVRPAILHAVNSKDYLMYLGKK